MKKIIWLLFLPYLWLACFAMPSADDFSFANKVKNLGLWGAQQDWYQTWTGRYSSSFLISLLTQFDFLRLYPVFSVFLFVLSFVSLFLLVKRFGDRENALWTTSVLYMCYLSSLPSLGENFYWLAGGVTYQLGIVFLLLWLSLRSFFWGFLFVPLLVGMNEMLMILVLLVLVFRFFFSEEKNYKTVCLLVLALCCCVTVVSAPGNELRLSYFSGNKSFFTTIWKSSAYLFRYLVEQLSHLELWGALFLLIPQLEKYHSKLNYRLMIVGGVAVLSLLFAPSFWSMNAPPPARAYALLCLVFFFFFFIYGAYFLSQYLKVNHKKLGFFFFIVGFLASSNTQNVYYDSIKVLSYQAQYNNRLAILDGCSEVCYVDPIFPLPKALNFSDIESDSSSWKNVEYAHYFNKKAIVLKKP